MSTIYYKYTIEKIHSASFCYLSLSVLRNEEITVEDVKIISQLCKETGEGEVLPLLIKVDKLTLPSAEARKYIALPESNPFAKAEAYVLQDLPQKIVGNFFLKFDKPARPTKIFTKEEEAVEWLKQFF